MLPPHRTKRTEMIPLTKEPPELHNEFKCHENCTFCKQPTDMWHDKTNNPVCPDCAKTHKVSELTNWFKKKAK